MIKQYLLIVTLLFGLTSSASVFAHSVNESESQPQDQAVRQVLPISASQIKVLQKRNQSLQKAEQEPAINQSQLAATVRNINLTDSAPPPLLHVVQGYISNISFVGANGKPWPISSAVPGGPALHVSQSSKTDPYNSSVTVSEPWVSTNITYYLKGRVRPITLYFDTSANTAKGLDGNVTVKIDGLPPGTTPLAVQNVTAVSDSLLNSLDHAPGSNWKQVKLSNTNIPVGIHYWISPDSKQAIIRLSSGTLLMPEWGSQASSPDGTVTSYQFDYIPLMLWVDSNHGENFQIRVDDPTKLIATANPVMRARSVSASAAYQNSPARSMPYVK